MGRRYIALLSIWLLAVSARSDVFVFVEQANGFAWIKYECTAGEVVRAFSLDVTVDQGRILGVSDYFVGESTVMAQGYGLFPASFRDHIAVGPGTTINWEVGGYTPLAEVADSPEDTLPGLGTAGVTLELGGLWDPGEPGVVPGSTGTLCALQISEGANVSVAANACRGGVVAVDPDRVLAPVFSGAFVQPPEIMSVSLSDGEVGILFAGGELESAGNVEGVWAGTGDRDGDYTDSVEGGTNKFYRVRSP